MNLRFPHLSALSDSFLSRSLFPASLSVGGIDRIVVPSTGASWWTLLEDLGARLVATASAIRRALLASVTPRLASEPMNGSMLIGSYCDQVVRVDTALDQALMVNDVTLWDRSNTPFVGDYVCRAIRSLTISAKTAIGEEPAWCGVAQIKNFVSVEGVFDGPSRSRQNPSSGGGERFHADSIFKRMTMKGDSMNTLGGEQ